MNIKLKRLLLPLLRATAKGGPVTFRMRSAAQQALFLVGKATSKSKGGRLRRVKPPGMPTGEIRAAIVDRANSKCELMQHCLTWFGDQMHHLEGGSGRRALETVENCMWVCSECHRAFHIRPEDFRTRVLEWAGEHGYPIPRRFRGPPKLLAPKAPTEKKPLTPHITHAQLKRSAP